MMKRSLVLILAVLCAVSVMGQKRKSKYPSKKRSSSSKAVKAPEQNAGLPVESTPVPAPAVGPLKVPIYSIFQQYNESRVKREIDMNKDSIKCAPEYPRVKAEDVVFARRLKRDIYFVEVFKLPFIKENAFSIVSDTFNANIAINTKYIIPIIFCLGVSLPPAMSYIFRI